MAADTDPGTKPDLEQFRLAVQTGNVDQVRDLLKQQSLIRQNINAPLFSFGTHAIAAAKNNIAMVDLLLSHGADINLRSDWWAGPWGILDMADAPTAEMLIARGATVDIWAAAHLNKLVHLQDLLNNDPSLANAKGGDGCRPLHFAWTAEAMDLLLQHGAEMEARDVDHVSTAAQWALPASDVGKTAITPGPGVKSLVRVRLFIQRGAKVDLFMAAALDDEPRLRAALTDVGGVERAMELTVGGPWHLMCPPAPGKSIYVYTLGEGKTAYQVAAEFGSNACLQLLAEHSTPRQRFLAACSVADETTARAELAKTPAMVSTLTPHEQSALPTAAWTGNLPAVQLMLTLGFNPAATGPQDGTALHAAAWRGRADMVQVILDHLKATSRLQELINLVDPRHNATPFGWYLDGSTNCHGDQTDFPRVKTLLLEAGADGK